MDAGTWWRRLRRVPASVADAGLAVAMGVAVAVAISVAPHQGQPPDAP